MDSYDHKEIEKKWQDEWKKEELYKTKDKVEGKENLYTLVEFPYPSGNLHIGHWYAFAVPDIFARTKRMQGYNVLYPIGFDAFGLPAENAAIKRGLDPKKWTYENIEYMEKQLNSMGASFDWSRKVVTSDKEYYKWTQWLFSEFYKKGLAYKKQASVNWCPTDHTVLANEQVVAGKCERCGTEVVQKDLEQWFFKITDYAERLLNDLENLNWPEQIKDSQRNWIGKSEGAEISFELMAYSLESDKENKSENYKLQAISSKLLVFTTRADTLYGATYIVIAPENKVLEELKPQIKNWSEIEKYIEESKNKTEIERTNEKKEKTGVELIGIKALNPATGEEIPVWIADYCLANYGTGAVMAVPAHDERDFAFATRYGLEMKEVLIPRMIDAANPHQEGREIIFRDAIIAILRNPKTNEILCLKWKKQPWTTFIMGGIENAEEPEEAAIREIREETGYKNIKLIQKLGTVQSEFFAAHKGVNRIAHTTSMLFELINEERDEISDEEKDIHDLEWIPENSVTPEKFAHIETTILLDRIKNGTKPYTAEGITINSGEFSKLNSKEARDKIAEKFGKKVTKYKLRDWLLSRQRYWGCPIPIVYDPEGKPHLVPEEHLPWLLPSDVDFAPKGRSPLESSVELKERTEKIFGKGFTPEYDTMDTFVDSSWYFLRYTDPQNTNEFADVEKIKSWIPVKRYSGGAEHTTMHLLFARFFYKVMFDLGLVPTQEPFIERMNRGLILGPDGQKMSKSKGNVIDPDEQVKNVGADTVRMYLSFIGPYNEVGTYPFDLGGIAGIKRFLERVWRLKDKIVETEMNKDTERLLHETIKKATEDIEGYKFNTAISAFMIFINSTEKTGINKNCFEIFLKLLAPFAPHITEELWHNLGNTDSIHLEKWPEYSEEKMKKDLAIIAIQINGKTRSEVEVIFDSKENEVRELSLNVGEVKKWIDGKSIKRVVYVKNRLINIIAE